MDMPKKIPPERGIRLYGAPDPERFTETGLRATLETSASIHFKEQQDRNRLVALEELAIAILEEPVAARAFALNPKEYLRRAGFPTVKIDLESREFKVALAMGDPAVREAARRGDVEGFVKAVMDQGIAPSLRSVVVLLAVEIGAYLSAVVVSWVIAAYTLETYVNAHHKVTVWGAQRLTVEHHLAELRRLAEMFGGPEFVREVESANMAKILADYCKLEAEARGV
jgi:hypothetical protein